MAIRFANTWERLAQSPFNLPSPRTCVPTLQFAIENVENGRGTLKILLVDVSAAMGQPLGEFIDRVR